MLNSTANEVGVTQERGSKCPQRHGKDGADTVNSDLFQSAHRKAVQTAEALEPTKHALDTRTGGINFLPLIGRLRPPHLS